MGLVDHARGELLYAQMLDEGSDYDGELGKSVLELITLFAKQGHSGESASSTLYLFNILARYGVINPIDNPMHGNNTYIDHTDISGGEPVFQSTLLSTLFSGDGGKTWYDLDKKRTLWERLTRSRRAYVKFPYLPKRD